MGLVLAQEVAGYLEDLDLAFELTDTSSRLPELGALGRRSAGDLAVIDTILAHPVAQAGGADAEAQGDLGGRTAGPYELDSTATELLRIGLGHGPDSLR